MIITISGTPGSGKSTIGKALAKHFGLKHYSTGDFARALAEKKGLSIADLNKLAESEPSIDRTIDEFSADLGRSEDGFIMDSRLAFHFIPDSIKVFVKCSPEEAARRIFGDVVSKKRTSERDMSSFEDAVESVKERMVSERKRYQDYYGLDVDDESQYDIIIDTSDKDQEQAIQFSIDAVEKHLKKE